MSKNTQTPKPLRNETVNLNLEPLAQLLTTEINPETLAKIVDDVVFSYANDVISNASQCIPSDTEANNIYWLRELRNAIWQTTHTEND